MMLVCMYVYVCMCMYVCAQCFTLLQYFQFYFNTLTNHTNPIGSASCIAKYALDPQSPIPTWVLQQCYNARSGEGGENNSDGGGDDSVDYTCIAISLVPRAMFLLVMVGLNLLMVASFMQGMSESGTVIATALSTGTNFSVSVRIGGHLYNILISCQNKSKMIDTR